MNQCTDSTRPATSSTRHMQSYQPSVCVLGCLTNHVDHVVGLRLLTRQTGRLNARADYPSLILPGIPTHTPRGKKKSRSRHTDFENNQNQTKRHWFKPSSSRGTQRVRSDGDQCVIKPLMRSKKKCRIQPHVEWLRLPHTTTQTGRSNHPDQSQQTHDKPHDAETLSTGTNQ
jgi:hypothetical protein